MSEFRAAHTVAEFFRSNADNRIIIGPLGSGKSSACTVELLQRAQRQQVGPRGLRRTRFAVIRNTYRELTDTTKVTMDEWLPEEISTWVESDMTYWLRFNDVECEILLRALDRPEDVKKLLSLDLTGAWINEAKEVPKSVFDMLQGRVGRFPSSKDGDRVTWCGVWMDSNPPDSDHWIYRTFEEFDKIDPDDRCNFRVFHQPSGLSPKAENIENLLGGQRKADGRPLYYAKMMPGKTQAWLDAFIHGKYSFVSDGRSVYPEYNDDIHAAKSFLEWRRGLTIFLGMDFGLTPALVIAQRIPGLLQWQVLDEITSEDMGAKRFAKHAAEYLKSTYPGARYRGWGDPSGDNRAQTDESTPFQIVQAMGLPIDPAPTNDPIRRREAVAGQLSTLGMTGQPSLIISPKAKTLRKGMGGGYNYARVQVSGEERFRDEPVKNKYSHICEALQYLMVGEGMDYSALDQGTDEDDDDGPVRVPKVHTAIGRSGRSPYGAR
jgi:Phage terminase large subunit